VRALNADLPPGGGQIGRFLEAHMKIFDRMDGLQLLFIRH
jgi:hypothetical protein